MNTALFAGLGMAPFSSFGPTMHGVWGTGYGPGFMGWGLGGFLGPVMMIFFWILIIAGIVYVARRLSGSSGPARKESAQDIAKRRYAGGEIGRDEFLKLMEDLNKP